MHKSLPILTSFAVISTLTACTIPVFAPKAPNSVAPAPQATSTPVVPILGVATGATILPEMLTGAVRSEGVASGSIVPGAAGSSVGVMPDGSAVTIPPLTGAAVSGSVGGSMPPLPPGATVTPISIVAPTEPVKPLVSPAPVKLAPAPIPVTEPVKPTPVTPAPTPTPTPTPAPPSSPTPVSSPEKTIGKAVVYSSPGGNEDIAFSLTVDSTNTVTSMRVTPKATNAISTKYQNNFAQNAPSQVIGRKLSELKLSVVSGASLTTGAFNEFVSGL